jgi:hypothetical protein
MIRYSIAALLLLSAVSIASAQQPGATYYQPTTITYAAPVEQVPAPTPVVVESVPCTQKICVRETKTNTKKVYTTHCKEYCQENCSLFSHFFGKGDCGCDCNCQVRTKKVLVKKMVPDCDTTQCVLKEVPATCAPCSPCGR